MALSSPTSQQDNSEEPTLSKITQLHQSLLNSYISQNPLSATHHKSATQVLPNGTTRSAITFSPFPLIFTSGQSTTLTSLDGHEYLDFVSEYSAAFFGHSNELILSAVAETLEHGINFGGCGQRETELAGTILKRFSKMGKVRFCNSGTEANLAAVMLARQVTGREKVVVFEGGYHGGFLQFSGSKPTIPFEFVRGRYNDLDVQVGGDVAAVLVEPMLGAGGMVPASEAFLKRLRKESTKAGAFLIFDEIITSRLHIGGLQGKYGIYPDMTTLGKYLGGGLSFGAFLGSDHIMGLIDGMGEKAITHSGTYNNNVLSMAAGIAAASLVTAEVIDKVNKLGDEIRDGINEMLDEGNNIGMKVTGIGSLIGIHFDDETVQECWFWYCLQRRIYVGKRGFVSLNICHDSGHIDQMLDAVAGFLELMDSL